MKKYILLCILFFSFFKIIRAHQSDFTEHCDVICLPYLGPSHKWNAVTSTDSALYLAGNSGVCFIYRYTGGAKSVYTGVATNLTGVQFLNTSIGFVWGTNGVLLKTTDGGNNWDSIATNTSDSINKIQFIDENTGYMMVDSVISKTINGGALWTPLTLPPSIKFKDFHFFDSQNGQICGQQTTPSLSGYLYATTNGGSSWNQLYTDTCAFTKLIYTNDSSGYLYGATNTDPLLLETNNMGNNWAVKYSSTSWTLGSDVVTYNNQTLFISNETMGSYIYGTPEFLDSAGSGIVYFPINLYTSHANNEEMLYLVTSAGLFRYVSGSSICKQLNFVNGVSANTSNPYNILAPGKKVRFKALFFNSTPNTIIEAKGTLRCSSPYISITDSMANFNNILNHQSSWSADEYEIELSAGIPDNYVVHLEFLFVNQNPAGPLQQSIIDLPIINNPFSLSSITTFDTATTNTLGNGNGIIEPNETAQLTPYIKNETAHYFYTVNGHLFSKFPQCAIWTNVALPDGGGAVYNNYTYGTLDPNQINQPAGPFVFTDSFKVNYNIPLTLALNGQLKTYTDENNYIYKNYSNILYNFGIDFIINDTFSLPPDSLLHPANPPATAIVPVTPSTFSSPCYLYPNPNNGEFSLITNHKAILENAVVEIYNLLGTRIYNHTIQDSTINITISDQPSGVYFLTVTANHSKQTIKIIKR
jgi:hypothetical protein